MMPGALLGQVLVILLLVVIVIFVIVVIAKAIRIVPQGYAGVVERLGKYQSTRSPGLNMLVPFVDRLRPLVDMREQVVTFMPQPVITGCGGKETTCSRMSTSGRTRSMNGTRMLRPGESVLWYLPSRSTTPA